MGDCHSKKDNRKKRDEHRHNRKVETIEKPVDPLRSTGDGEDLEHRPSSIMEKEEID